MILTPRLRLRALAPGDLALFRALYCDAETMRHVGPPLASGEVRPSFSATLAAARSLRGPWFFTIVEKRRCAGVGLCSMRNLSTRKRSVEIGIMLVPAARGVGYARETFAALIDAALQALPIDAVWVHHSRANAEAARLNHALGFRPVSVRRTHSNHRGQRTWILQRPKRHHPSHQPTKGKSMSNIIGFLEQVGSNAAMRHASRESLLRTLREEETAPALRHAPVQAQRLTLDDLAGARETMYCLNTSIKPPKKKKAPAKKKPAKKAPAKKPAKKAPAKRKK